MGSCCSQQESHDPNKIIDSISTTEPLVRNRSNFDPNLGKVDNQIAIFQKTDISASDDDIDTKELDNMMKTDDEHEDNLDDDENDIDDDENIEEEQEQD